MENENKCKNCGGNIGKRDLFCPNCGCKIQQNVKKKENLKEDFINFEKVETKGDNKKMKIVIFSILAVVLIICLSFTIPYNIEKNRKFTIRFDSNGGSSCNSISTNQTDLNLPTSNRENCYFGGWFTYEGIAAEKAIANNKEKKDIKLYAKWYTYKSFNIDIPDYDKYMNSFSSTTYPIFIIIREIDFAESLPNANQVSIILAINQERINLSNGEILFRFSQFSMNFDIGSRHFSLNVQASLGKDIKNVSFLSYNDAINLQYTNITNIKGSYKFLTEVD